MYLTNEFIEGVRTDLRYKFVEQNCNRHISMLDLLNKILLQVCSPTCNVEGRTLLPGDRRELQVLTLGNPFGLDDNSKSDFLIHFFKCLFESRIFAITNF